MSSCLPSFHIPHPDSISLFLVALKIEPRVWCVLGKHFTTELCPIPSAWYFIKHGVAWHVTHSSLKTSDSKKGYWGRRHRHANQAFESQRQEDQKLKARLPELHDTPPTEKEACFEWRGSLELLFITVDNSKSEDLKLQLFEFHPQRCRLTGLQCEPFTEALNSPGELVWSQPWRPPNLNTF